MTNNSIHIIIVICILVLIVCSLMLTLKVDNFVTGTPLDNVTINKGIPLLDNTNPLPMYFKEITLNEAKIMLSKIVSYNLKNNIQPLLASRAKGSWFITLSKNDNSTIKQLCVDYIMKKINSLVANVNEPFTYSSPILLKVEALKEFTLCTVALVIHRVSKHYGFSLTSEVLLKNENIEGIINIDVTGYVAEDMLMLENGYEGKTESGDAFNINHQILKNKQFENIVLQKQADAIFKDRGIKAPNN